MCGSCGARGDALVEVEGSGKEALLTDENAAAAEKAALEAAEDETSEAVEEEEAAEPAELPWLKRPAAFPIAVVLVLLIGGVATAVAYFVYGRGEIVNPTVNERDQRVGIPLPKLEARTVIEEASGAYLPGQEVWSRTLRSQTHAMVTIDDW